LDNVLLNQGDCVRPHPLTNPDYPIPLVTSADMNLGWLPYASYPANRKCPIAAGSTIGIQWHHNSNQPSDDIIELTHLGPISFYLAKSETGAGNVWFKIYEDGLSNGQWAVQRLVANGGRVDFTIPADIEPGNYLLRGELFALHNAYMTNGIQPYVGAVELTITGSGTAKPAGVSFPGYYTNDGPGMMFDLYSSYNSYTIPGPAIYKSGSSTGVASTTGSSGSSTAPTNRPTSAPTARPPYSGNGQNLLIQVNGGSNTWWFGASFTGGSAETVKVELKDSGSVNIYQTMALNIYGFYFSQSVQLTLPISLRCTSASGQQIVLENYVVSFTDSAIKDTGRDYVTPVTNPTTMPTTAPTYPPTYPPTRPTYAPTNSPTNPPTTAPTNPPTNPPTTRPTSTPTSRPTTTPTTPPTVAPTNPPASSTTGTPNDSVKFSVHSGSSVWWFAVAISGLDDSSISKVELKDSDSSTPYYGLTNGGFGYYIYNTNGKPLVLPVTVRVTSTTGSTYATTINSL